MIRVKFIETLAEKEKADGRRYKVTDIADGVGVSRATIYTWMKQGELQTVTLSTLDKLCNYFNCGVADLLEHQR